PVVLPLFDDDDVLHARPPSAANRPGAECCSTDQLREAARYLTGLATADPVLRALLLAPPEDEELEPEELEAIEAGRQAYERGEYASDQDLARELGECPLLA